MHSFHQVDTPNANSWHIKQHLTWYSTCTSYTCTVHVCSRCWLSVVQLLIFNLGNLHIHVPRLHNYTDKECTCTSSMSLSTTVESGCLVHVLMAEIAIKHVHNYWLCACSSKPCFLFTHARDWIRSKMASNNDELETLLPTHVKESVIFDHHISWNTCTWTPWLEKIFQKQKQ